MTSDERRPSDVVVHGDCVACTESQALCKDCGCCAHCSWDCRLCALSGSPRAATCRNRDCVCEGDQ